jgi:saccharopine dehydrogenase-like NADP-dependent oxidoreductase
VLVLGGAGNFGARIVRALKDEPGLALVSAGRRAIPVPGAGDVPTVILDIEAADFAARLQSLLPDLVIHCAGPFQTQDYRVAHAALAAGADYMDLADGRDFVSGFAAAMNSTAVGRDHSAISGASTLPALSTAVIDALCVGLSAHSIRMVIAPGQRAPRGAATLAAVLGYLGKPIPVWRAGRWQTDWGWMGLQRFRFAFGKRWGAVCDVADLALLPARYPPLQEATFHASLEFRLQHMVLWILAALRRLGLPLPVEQWSGTLDRMASLFNGCGGEWGGMQVQVTGVTAAGRRLRRTWTLQAPAQNGPEIPCMPAILLARRWAGGHRFPAGAYACMGMLSLEDFAPLFAGLGITTQLQEFAP